MGYRKVEEELEYNKNVVFRNKGTEFHIIKDEFIAALTHPQAAKIFVSKVISAYVRPARLIALDYKKGLEESLESKSPTRKKYIKRIEQIKLKSKN